MSIRCKNGTEHTHETVAETRLCWHRKYFPVAARPVAASPPPPALPEPMTPKQRQYIIDLGGTPMGGWTKTRAHEEINKLLDDREARKTEERAKRVTDPRLEMVKGMLPLIPDGYYATAPEGSGGHIDFVRISRPMKGRFKGALKVHTQHSEAWKEALILWPSGQWSVYRTSAVDTLLLVIADHKSCARRYGIELQSCMRCNKELTDDRSRHYLVGPECETKHGFTWPIEYADEQNNGLSYEQLVARGLPTRVWQERVA
jgi:hypothetical protein